MDVEDDEYDGDTDVESTPNGSSLLAGEKTESRTSGTRNKRQCSSRMATSKTIAAVRHQPKRGKPRQPPSNRPDNHAEPQQRLRASTRSKRPVRRSPPKTTIPSMSGRKGSTGRDGNAKSPRRRTERKVKRAAPEQGSLEKLRSQVKTDKDDSSSCEPGPKGRARCGPEDVALMLYQCGVCDKAYATKKTLQQHLLDSSHSKVVRCGRCGQTFSSPEELVTHARRHAPRPFLCSQCPSTFTSSHHLKRHAATHGSEKRFKCRDCPSAFHQLVNLTVHMRSHTGEKPFGCDQCPAAFTLSSNLKRHRRLHTGEKPFMCGVCRKAFRVSSQLKVHARIHTGEKSFRCPQCPAAFVQSSSLKTHLNLHRGVKPHTCALCPAAFAEATNLKVHMRTHNGERPFLCEQCPRAFSQSSSLKKHRLIHSGERRFACPLCPKRFRLPHGLKRHLAIHDEGRHFRCQHCPAKFLRQEYLRAHMFLHNGQTPWLSGKPGDQRARSDRQVEAEEGENSVESSEISESKEGEKIDRSAGELVKTRGLSD